MTPFPFSVDAEDTLARARQLMEEHEIRHLPVKDGDQLVGVITERDLQVALGRSAGAAEKLRVRQVCETDLYATGMATPLRVVAEEMARRRIGSALITKDGRLAGVFTVTDACRCLAERLGSGDPGDEAA